MAKLIFKTSTDKLRDYSKENFGAPFIIAFIITIIFTAVSLSIGLTSVAYVAAIVAYISLVIGVILQFACFLKREPKNEDLENDDGS